ncbi:MAG: DUF3127 domain-containing protein [Verrucomicrobiales bacterium]|nr:DUF3127 domain-containing protein [Verrucomicrobiota bacterium JB025]
MAQTYELTGTVKHIFDTQTFNSGFTKREFVVETGDDKYPQHIKFETVKDKTALLDQIAIGEQVTVSFDIRGNEYKERYYVNLSAWKIQKNGGGGDTSSDAPDIDSQFDNEPDPTDDIPF